MKNKPCTNMRHAIVRTLRKLKEIDAIETFNGSFLLNDKARYELTMPEDVKYVVDARLAQKLEYQRDCNQNQIDTMIDVADALRKERDEFKESARYLNEQCDKFRFENERLKTLWEKRTDAKA